MEVVMMVLPMVRGWTWETVVGVTEGMQWWVVEEMLVWEMEGLRRGFVAGSLGLSESSWKTSSVPFFLEFLFSERGGRG